MVKLKVSKKKGPPTDSNDDYVGSSDEEVHTRHKQSTKKGATKRNVRGRGTANPPGRVTGTRRTSRRQSSSALADSSNPRIEADHDIDLSYLEYIMATITRPTRDSRDPPMINYKKGGNSVDHLRYSENPTIVERSFRGDPRFWFPIKPTGMSQSS